MTAPTSFVSSSPPGQHAWTLQYLRLRLIANFLHYLVRPLVLLGYYTRSYNYHVPASGGVSRRVIRVKVPSTGRLLPIIIYTPNAVAKPRGTVLNWHGSGFVLPNHGIDSLYCSHVAARLGCTVLDVDYVKAPKYPFPWAVREVEDVLSWFFAHGQTEQGLDTEYVALSGFSAGGNLSLVGSTLFTKPPSTSHPGTPNRNQDRIQAIACFYPVTDFTKPDGSKAGPGGKAPRLLVRLFRFFSQSYIPKGTNVRDPRLSVLLAPSDSFPKRVWIAAGDLDTLYKDGQDLVQKLNKERPSQEEDPQIRATFITAAQRKHGWDQEPNTKSKEEGAKYYELVVEEFREAWRLKEEQQQRQFSAASNGPSADPTLRGKL